MPNVLPSLPSDFSKIAFLLDVDGTIVDLAATPREVYVPHALRDTLRRLLERTGGAVAFVSGRPIAELDLLFSPLELPCIGGHGAELRTKPGEAPAAPRLPSLDHNVKRRFAAIAEAAPKAPAAAKNVEPAEAPKIAEAVSAEPVSEPVSEPPAVPLAKGERDFWAAHELEAVPPVDPDVACPCEDVLRGVGKSMTEFVRSLERFTATERLEHYAVDRSGARRSCETE